MKKSADRIFFRFLKAAFLVSAVFLCSRALCLGYITIAIDRKFDNNSDGYNRSMLRRW